MENPYFQVLPEETKQALGKAAFDNYLRAEPPFEFTGRWEDMSHAMQSRWMTVVESIFNQIDMLEGHVQTKLELFNQAREVLQSAVERFEAIKPDDSMLNNYQLLEWLQSANAEVTNARLLMLRADIEAGNVNHSGDGSTQKVIIPNIRKME